MQLRQFRALSAAKAAHLFLAQDAPPVVLTQASAGFGTQVTHLRSLIDAVEARALEQDPSTWKNRNAARDAAVKQLRDLSLRSLRQLARVIVARPSGGTVSAEFPSLIPVPETSHVEAILQAAHATVQQLAPYQALFVAWGLAPDFLGQLTAETAQVEALAEAAREARQTQLTATRDIARLLGEIRQTLHGLTSALRYWCAKDGARGAVTYATWLQIKRPRQAARTAEQTAVSAAVPSVPAFDETPTAAPDEAIEEPSEETPKETTAVRPQIPAAHTFHDICLPSEFAKPLYPTPRSSPTIAWRCSGTWETSQPKHWRTLYWPLRKRPLQRSCEMAHTWDGSPSLNMTK